MTKACHKGPGRFCFACENIRALNLEWNYGYCETTIFLGSPSHQECLCVLSGKHLPAWPRHHYKSVRPSTFLRVLQPGIWPLGNKDKTTLLSESRTLIHRLQNHVKMAAVLGFHSEWSPIGSCLGCLFPNWWCYFWS